MIDGYRWRGGDEAMLRFGAHDAPTILILPPLFEEANRMRAVLVGVMRRLADDRNIASVMPDLPGTGDSMIATIDARFADWADAVAALASTLPIPRLTVSVRGGAVLDRFAQADARWRLMPESGARLLRDMLRATALSSGEKPADLAARAHAEPVCLGGNMIHPDLFRALDAAASAPDADVRTARLDDDGDIRIGGTPVWRRAEPDTDVDLVEAMVGDISHWVGRCVGR